MGMALTDKPLLVFDGACGTNLQAMDIPDSAWDGHNGCNEYLNLSSPETIVALQYKFLWTMYALQSADARPTAQAKEAVMALERSLGELMDRRTSLE